MHVLESHYKFNTHIKLVIAFNDESYKERTHEGERFPRTSNPWKKHAFHDLCAEMNYNFMYEKE